MHGQRQYDPLEDSGIRFSISQRGQGLIFRPNLIDKAQEEFNELMEYPDHILEKKSGLLDLE